MARSWNIAVRNEDLNHRNNLDTFVGETFKLSTGCVVVVNRAFEIFTQIVVKDVPPNWGQNTVERIFKTYGRIAEVRQE